VHKKDGKNTAFFLRKFEKPEQHAHSLSSSYCCCSDYHCWNSVSTRYCYRSP